MEDKQSIIALGAGGVGKIYYPEKDRIERVANVSNYEIYKNAKSQTEMNNAFQSLVSQQQNDGNNKASLDK